MSAYRTRSNTSSFQQYKRQKQLMTEVSRISGHNNINKPLNNQRELNYNELVNSEQQGKQYLKRNSSFQQQSHYEHLKNNINDGINSWDKNLPNNYDRIPNNYEKISKNYDKYGNYDKSTNIYDQKLTNCYDHSLVNNYLKKQANSYDCQNIRQSKYPQSRTLQQQQYQSTKQKIPFSISHHNLSTQVEENSHQLSQNHHEGEHYPRSRGRLQQTRKQYQNKAQLQNNTNTQFYNDANQNEFKNINNIKRSVLVQSNLNMLATYEQQCSKNYDFRQNQDYYKISSNNYAQKQPIGSGQQIVNGSKLMGNNNNIRNNAQMQSIKSNGQLEPISINNSYSQQFKVNNRHNNLKYDDNHFESKYDKTPNKSIKSYKAGQKGSSERKSELIEKSNVLRQKLEKLNISNLSNQRSNSQMVSNKIDELNKYSCKFLNDNNQTLQNDRLKKHQFNRMEQRFRKNGNKDQQFKKQLSINKFINISSQQSCQNHPKILINSHKQNNIDHNYQKLNQYSNQKSSQLPSIQNYEMNKNISINNNSEQAIVTIENLNKKINDRIRKILENYSNP